MISRPQTGRGRSRSSRAWPLLVAWALGAFGLTLLVGMLVERLRPTAAESDPLGALPEPPRLRPASEPTAFSHLQSPTEWDLGVPEPPEDLFMPTGAGRLESALFGSTRTGSDGRARFHAGVDIAPRDRDRRGRPLDPVRAVADGRVAYINRAPGGSSYGVYVVLLHDDPVGTVYTLYAHLASAERGLAVGSSIAAGETLGVMGNTANTRIPMFRAHLHFEIGVLLSSRFGIWARENEIRPDRGNYHGWNLVSVDPLEVFRAHRTRRNFALADFLRETPVAFEVAIRCARPLDYFERHPTLWQGPRDRRQGVIVLSVSEGGVVLRGRPATEIETAAVDAGPAEDHVLRVDPDVLGRNGMRLVERRGDDWTLGSGARRWLALLRY